MDGAAKFFADFADIMDPETSSNVDPAARMLPGFTNRPMESRDPVTRNKNISKQKCIHILTSFIKQAQGSLDISCFAIQQDVVIKEIIKLLKRNVHTRVILDQRQETKVKECAEKLKAAGVDVRWMPVDKLLHMKMCLIDSNPDVVYTGNIPIVPKALVSLHHNKPKVLNDVVEATFYWKGDVLIYYDRFMEAWALSED